MVSHILFDLDDTLWDCAGNSVLSLHKLFEAHDLSRFFESFDNFNRRYQRNNDILWAGLPDNGKTVAEVRIERFVMTLDEVGQDGKPFGDRLNEDYMHLMVKCPGTMPYAEEVLAELSKRYEIDIITNGISDVQRGKLQASRLEKYISQIFVSDEIGAMKPKQEYFDAVMSRLGCPKSSCLVIGDNPTTDIKGATDAGIEAIWYNWRNAAEDKCQCKAIVRDLRQLCEIL